MSSADFVKIHSKKYKAWRILSAKGSWVEVYTGREKMLRNYRSAIIFPEQLLGLNQSSILQVTESAGSGVFNISVHPVNRFDLFYNGVELNSLTEILEVERSCYGDDDISRIKVGETFGQSFVSLILFTNKKDVLKYINSASSAALANI